MPEQPQTLAARIRAKYPGAYDDVADIELEQRVTAKFPGTYDDVPRTEATLTRERRPAGAPSALEAKHHPETLSGGEHGVALRAIENWETPSDSAFLKRGPEVGGMAGMVLGGPVGAGAGAALGSLAKGQHAQGAHVPTGREIIGSTGEGVITGASAATPLALLKGARRIGPAVATNAPAISKGVSALTGLGAGIASVNPLTGIGTGAAARMLATPGAIRAAGNAATRVGMVPSHIASTAGVGTAQLGGQNADAFRQALLDALGAESSASAVP
jgi:hypothetical protein